MSDQGTKNKTVLGPDCRISGELALDNDAVIMGQFKGTLRVTGMLELTDSARVAGTVVAGTLSISGEVEADIVAEGGVELLPGAVLRGHVYTSQINVVEGATFEGDICVGAKAMEAAGPLLRQIEEAEGQPIQQSATYTEAADEPAIQTNAGVNSILQRRRSRVLTTNGAANGNGHHDG